MIDYRDLCECGWHFSSFVFVAGTVCLLVARTTVHGSQTMPAALAEPRCTTKSVNVVTIVRAVQARQQPDPSSQLRPLAELVIHGSCLLILGVSPMLWPQLVPQRKSRFIWTAMMHFVCSWIWVTLMRYTSLLPCELNHMPHVCTEPAESWKVMEFDNPNFQAWKVPEIDQQFCFYQVSL